jgi:spore germination protein
MLENKKFSGIDIDYEGKDMADKDVFSRFIVELAIALKYREYSLSCTVEARTNDFPPSGWHGVRAMAWANDYNVLNAYCDEVRIMAYDQAIVTKGAKTEWHGDLKQLYAPLADIKWVEEIIKYSLRSIHKNKKSEKLVF